MMNKKISLMILGDIGSRVRRFDFSVKLLYGLALGALCMLACLGAIVYGYHGLRTSITANGQMTRTIIEQRDQIARQRLQIQSFADEINTLKLELVDLNQFEEKMRVIANLEPGNGLFGVGGVPPEDLDPQLELNQRHEELMRQMHRQVNALDTAAFVQADNFGELLDQLEDRRDLLASTPAIRPTIGWMTSRFGRRVSPFTGRKEFHKGIDIAHRKGTAILATANGVVSFAGKKGAMGKMVVIDHGHGMLTRYAHLDQTLRKRGENVTRGDVIAKMGNSGRSTGPHLHYEVHLNGVPVNPTTYILK